MVGSDDEVLQDAAAGCLSNIRKLAMANQKAKQEAKRKRAAERKANDEKRKKEEKLTSSRNGRESTGSCDSFRSEELSYDGRASETSDRAEEEEDKIKRGKESSEPHNKKEERTPSPDARNTKSA